MASLLEKVRVLVAADLNRWVDRALRSSEPAVFQHHVRELQSLQGQLSDQMAALSAEVADLRRRNDAQQALVSKQDQDVDALLQAGLHEEALSGQDRLNQARQVAAALGGQLELLEQQYAEMVAAQGQLDARIQALREQEPAATGLAGLARAKQLTAEALESLNDISGTGDPDAAVVIDAIRTRLAEAEAQLHELEQRGLAHGETPEALRRKELESQLEARKARLGLN